MTTESLLYLSAVLFGIGCFGVIIRRNAIVVFMSVEIMMNGINLSLMAFSAKLANMEGMMLSFFVLIIAAAEAVIGLSIILMMYRNKRTIQTNVFRFLKSSDD